MQKPVELRHDGLVLRGMEHIPTTSERVPALLIHHGFTGNKVGSHRLFVKLSRALAAAGIAAFRFDFMGSGESDGDYVDMTIAHQIAEAKAMLDYVQSHPQVDPERVMVLGMSLGGLVAGIVAGERPQDVQKLVLLCPAGNMYDLVKDSVEASLANPSLQWVDTGGERVGRAFGLGLRDIDGIAQAKPYQGPVLIIHGTGDPVVPYSMAQLYQANAYNGRAQLHTIEGADHTFNKYEWEVDVIDTVLAFTRAE